jgi:Protein of unknown function (DUF3892)
MAARIEISCINKTYRYDPHKRISDIGGVNSDGARWKLSLDQAIAGIESDKWSFWTRSGGRVADVVIAKHNNNKYLKTAADYIQPDNLLSLPKCP